MTVAGRTQIVPSGGQNASPASLLLTFVNPLSRRSVILRLIRLLAPTVAALLLAACSTYEATVGALDKTFEQGPSSPQQRHVPKVDLSQAKWYKLTADQPTSNPLRVAIVERDTRVGAMRAVIKAPPDFKLPPYWFAVGGHYTVLKGTFVFDTIDADGKPHKLTQGPGSFTQFPANLIQRGATAPGDEGLLYFTVYGDWNPLFAEGAWGPPPPQQPLLRRGS